MCYFVAYCTQRFHGEERSLVLSSSSPSNILLNNPERRSLVVLSDQSYLGNKYFALSRPDTARLTPDNITGATERFSSLARSCQCSPFHLHSSNRDFTTTQHHTTPHHLPRPPSTSHKLQFTTLYNPNRACLSARTNLAQIPTIFVFKMDINYISAINSKCRI
jgi:hypothetical protein